MSRFAQLAAAFVVTLALAGCRSAPPDIAFDNRVFYHYDSSADFDPSDFEKRYPPLDLSQAPPRLSYLGYEVLGGTVRLSRPADWVIRSASNQPERRFIEYVSPRQLMLSVYERIESPRDPWLDILQRYEKEVDESGGRPLSRALPVAVWNAQGRAYTVERRVAAPKAPLVNRAREYLLRSDRRIVLLQLVYQGKDMAHIEDEALRVCTTMQVL